MLGAGIKLTIKNRANLLPFLKGVMMIKKVSFLLIIWIFIIAANNISAETSPQSIFSSSTVNQVQIYKDISAVYVGEWTKYGETFTLLQKNYFKTIYLIILIAIPVAFLLHYIVVGPKEFSHSGENIHFFTTLNRVVHWIAAISFLLLTITGIVVIFGKIFGGGGFVRNLRYLHFISAAIFTPFGLIMFFMWLKNMLPSSGDITWFLKLGGYLSKKEMIMPVGKFNPGQKAWFWLGTLGGFVMAFTGYFIYSFQANVDSLRLYAIIHNVLGMALVAMFLVHLYMSIFAIKGSLKSMITGYKSEHEVKVMHYKYYTQVTGKE